MRITVLEWICGGGLNDCSLASVPPGLRREGWAMLDCLLEQFSMAGHQVVTVLDRRLVEAMPREGGRVEIQDFTTASEAQAGTGFESALAVWLDVARRGDLTLIVAPEIDRVLERLVERFEQAGLPVLNCSGSFLAACSDKWQTATRLQAAGIPHPVTWCGQLPSDRGESTGQRWCLKPRWGAGCEGLVRGCQAELGQHLSMVADPSQWIVQPWIEGQALSCSGLVDRSGVAHWFPLVTQRLTPQPRLAGGECLRYDGGRLAPPEIAAIQPTGMLNAAMGALGGQRDGKAVGWVGIDLVLDRAGQWTVIEVNPRLTTSVLGLSRTVSTHLGQLMLDAYLLSGKLELEHDWREDLGSAELGWNAAGLTP